jgi:beta-lactamase regulating signal transducer with metallopeptidase domain
LWRPKLILPLSLAKAAANGELDAVLLHELAHLRRRDLAWIWIPQLARIFYWFHPLSHWLIHRIRLEAELSCDGIAMAASGQGAGDYAKMLVDVMNRLAEPALLRSSPEAVGMEGGDA